MRKADDSAWLVSLVTQPHHVFDLRLLRSSGAVARISVLQKVKSGKDMIKFRVQTAFFILFFSTGAHAYVDPGTGSLAVQFLIGGLVALGFMIKTYYYSLKSKVRSLLGRPDPSESLDPAQESAGAADISSENTIDKS